MGDLNAREWMYVDEQSGSVKGPVPGAILVRMLEKGLGVSSNTIAWKGSIIMYF